MVQFQFHLTFMSFSTSLSSSIEKESYASLDDDINIEKWTNTRLKVMVFGSWKRYTIDSQITLRALQVAECYQYHLSGHYTFIILRSHWEVTLLYKKNMMVADMFVMMRRMTDGMVMMKRNVIYQKKLRNIGISKISPNNLIKGVIFVPSSNIFNNHYYHDLPS